MENPSDCKQEHGGVVSISRKDEENEPSLKLDVCQKWRTRVKREHSGCCKTATTNTTAVSSLVITVGDVNKAHVSINNEMPGIFVEKKNRNLSTILKKRKKGVIKWNEGYSFSSTIGSSGIRFHQLHAFYNGIKLIGSFLPMNKMRHTKRYR